MRTPDPTPPTRVTLLTLLKRRSSGSGRSFSLTRPSGRLVWEPGTTRAPRLFGASTVGRIF